MRRDKLTNKIGNNEVVISPDEAHFAIRQSFSNVPWELYLLANTSDAKEKQITKSTTKEFDAYDWKVPENITFKASDGVEVYARLYQPEGGAKGKPMVVFVHGAGYLQNAHRWWSGYFREYMFHNILVDNGRLNQRLIELEKENWNMALYPLERHGFVEPSSWTDEYKRIYKLFVETLK